MAEVELDDNGEPPDEAAMIGVWRDGVLESLALVMREPVIYGS